MAQVAQYQFALTDAGTPVTVRRIGEKMLSTDAGGYALPFEIISMLLLAAMVGAFQLERRQARVLVGLDARIVALVERLKAELAER